MDRKAFYDTVRPVLGALTAGQVSGFERYLDEASRRATPLDRLAYILATVFWETARTMQPVKEAYWKSETWRKANLRYFPWYGRGDVQLTWEANYRKAGKAIGVDLIANPDAALDPANSVRITFEGMEQGWFTGKALGDYLDGVDESDDEDLREFANARRIINGTDKQIEIGKLALAFEKALRAAAYDHASASEPVAEPIILPPSAQEPAVAEPVVNPNLTPIEQMNKPVQGAKAGFGVTTVSGALLYLWSKTAAFPLDWKTDPQAMIALTLVAASLPGLCANFIMAYRARDKRFQAPAA